MTLMNTPKSVEIEITNRCNLRCKHCYYYTSASDGKKDLPAEEWLKFFEELNHCAVMNVTLCGGEPFFRKDLKEIINGIVRNRMRFSILTNGTLVTEEISSFLSSTGRCDHVQVSIDGSVPEIHDTLRGNGNFEKAIRGLKSLQKHNVPLRVRVTIFKNNVNDLYSIAKLLLEDIGLQTFSTNSASHMGLCRQNAEMVQLSAEERTRAMEILLKLDKKYNGRITANAGPLAEAKDWLNVLRVQSEGHESIPGRGYLAACGGVFCKIAIRADGVLVPCNLLTHIELGRINQDNFKEIWQDHPELKKLRTRHNIPLTSFEFCKDCTYANYCTGGCPATAYTFMNNVYHSSPDSCLKRFLEEGGRLPDEKLLVSFCSHNSEYIK